MFYFDAGKGVKVSEYIKDSEREWKLLAPGLLGSGICGKLHVYMVQSNMDVWVVVKHPRIIEVEDSTSVLWLSCSLKHQSLEYLGCYVTDLLNEEGSGEEMQFTDWSSLSCFPWIHVMSLTPRRTVCLKSRTSYAEFFFTIWPRQVFLVCVIYLLYMQLRVRGVFFHSLLQFTLGFSSESVILLAVL